MGRKRAFAALTAEAISPIPALRRSAAYSVNRIAVFAIAPGMIPGYGMGNALALNVQDKQGGDMNTFFQTTQQYLAALNQRPEISMAYSTFDVRYPRCV